MNARSLLQALRDGHDLTQEDLYEFGRNLGGGVISDTQTGAFAMGVCKVGLSQPARVGLTLGMRDSGDVMQWDLPGKVIDKHSTGGVGDAVSLLLAPMLAAVGGFVPMISGRGLGHTGGTLDKLESIPGVTCGVSEAKFRKIVANVGCAIVAPNRNIAPADSRLYAARDVTGTVRSLDLITSSILSKKLAAGLDALVLDVKVGSGAVMASDDDAKALAQSLVTTANGAGCPCKATISDMNQPLLPAIGNGLEVLEIVRCFQSGQGRLVDLSIDLGVDLLMMAHLFYTEKGAQDALRKSLSDGSAFEKFGQMVAAQGGPKNFVERSQDYLEVAPAYRVRADRSGWLTGIDGTVLGNFAVMLGAGRKIETDKIDPSVGFSEVLSLGAKVEKGDTLINIHARSQSDADNLGTHVRAAFTIGDEHMAAPPVIVEKVGA